MPGAFRATWRRWRLLWPRAVALAVVLSLLTVVTAPIWHDHANEGLGHGRGYAFGGPRKDQGSNGHNGHDKQKPHDEDDCSLCAAVHAPTGDGLPSLPLFVEPCTAEMVRWLGAERAAVLWVGSDHASRGPPLQS